MTASPLDYASSTWRLVGFSFQSCCTTFWDHAAKVDMSAIGLEDVPAEPCQRQLPDSSVFVPKDDDILKCDHLILVQDENELSWGVRQPTDTELYPDGSPGAVAVRFRESMRRADTWSGGTLDCMYAQSRHSLTSAAQQGRLGSGDRSASKQLLFYCYVLAREKDLEAAGSTD